MPKKKPLAKSVSEKEIYQGRIRELLRSILGGLELKDIQEPDGFQGDDRREFARFCHETYNHRFFKPIIQALYLPHLMYAAKEAPNYDVVSFNRASANGIGLVEDYFLKWANIFDEEFTNHVDEGFDPNRSFEPTKKIIKEQ